MIVVRGDPKLEAVCVYDAPLVFDGSNSDTATSGIDLGELDLDLAAAATSRVTMRSAVVTAGVGVDDFRFADRVRVQLLPTNNAP